MGIKSCELNCSETKSLITVSCSFSTDNIWVFVDVTAINVEEMTRVENVCIYYCTYILYTHLEHTNILKHTEKMSTISSRFRKVKQSKKIQAEHEQKGG